MPRKIKDWKDMETYGVNALTGEACNVGLRLLCDVNDTGKQLLNHFFGCQVNFASPWNSQVGGQESTGSIMLPKGIFPELAVFAIFTGGEDRGKGVLLVAEEGSEYYGYTHEDREELQKFVDTYEKWELGDPHDSVEDWQRHCIRRFNKDLPPNKQADEKYAVWTNEEYEKLDLLSRFSFLKGFLYSYVHTGIMRGGFRTFRNVHGPAIGMNATHAMSGRTMVGSPTQGE